MLIPNRVLYSAVLVATRGHNPSPNLLLSLVNKLDFPRLSRSNLAAKRTATNFFFPAAHHSLPHALYVYVCTYGSTVRKAYSTCVQIQMHACTPYDVTFPLYHQPDAAPGHHIDDRVSARHPPAGQGQLFSNTRASEHVLYDHARWRRGEGGPRGGGDMWRRTWIVVGPNHQRNRSCPTHTADITDRRTQICNNQLYDHQFFFHLACRQPAPLSSTSTSAFDHPPTPSLSLSLTLTSDSL